MSESRGQIKKAILLALKIIAIEETLNFIFDHYFFEIEPFSFSISFFIFFLLLLCINWSTKKFQKPNYFKPTHILITAVLLFLVVHLRAGIFWAFNTFPLKDANTVLLTLQEPFDDFAYLMIRKYLSATIPQALIITVILTVFLYVLLSSTRKRLFSISVYFIATIILCIYDLPVSNYIHILNNEPEKSATYSSFFVDNYINPDSVKIIAPEQKRNLILIYLESLETSFSDKEHGGFQDTNLIPEITTLALQNINFGKNKEHIGGGLDANGAGATFAAMQTRTLGIPAMNNYKKTPALRYCKSLYKILSNHGYNQIFFQGNPGMFTEFQNFTLDQTINEVYGPEDLIQRLNLNAEDLIRKQGGRTVQDKEAFLFAKQILDTISEPFSLTFFTIDTHAPHGLYDPDCIKVPDEKNEDERLKAAARCVSRELSNFLDTLKTKAFYNNTSIIIFGDHLFMGTRLVKGAPNRRWIDIFINTQKTPISEEKRQFSDIDMFPTILSSINFDIEGGRLGFGTDLFSDKKTLVESLGLDSVNKGTSTIISHLVYESYLLQKNSK